MQEVIKSIEPCSKELIDGFIKACADSIGWQLHEDSGQRCSRSFYLLFDSITNFMSKVKSTEGSVGFIAEDMDQNFTFGAVVEYHKNDNPDMPGNWSYTFTFDPNDMKDCITVYKMSSNEYKEVAIDLGEHYYGLDFELDNSTNVMETKRILITQIMTNASKAIRQWVEENSVSPQPITTEIKNKVIIEAMLDETGTKVFAITPSGELKNVIKDDAAIEQQKEKEKAKKK